MKLRYVVITSVDRDDLRDGGAGHFARCTDEVRALNPGIKIEVLVPDFRGKGRLVVGYDADITLVDLKEKRVVRDEDMATRVGWTPFAGMELQGWPVGTIVRGTQVMRDGHLLEPAAEPVRFH